MLPAWLDDDDDARNYNNITIPPYNYHHQGVLTAWILLNLSRHLSLLSRALRNSSRRRPELKNVAFCFSANTSVSIRWIPCKKLVYKVVLLFLAFLIIFPGMFVRWKVSGHRLAVYKRSNLRVCSKYHSASLRRYHLVFHPNVSKESKKYNISVALIRLEFGRIPFLFYQR